MKKIKIMLLSLALFAVVGAALAFKAKFSVKYCTTAVVNGVCPANASCPNLIVNKTTTTIAADGVVYCTTTPTTFDNGTEIISTCFKDNNGSKTLPCNLTNTIKAE
jgi:hypothetical protein